MFVFPMDESRIRISVAIPSQAAAAFPRRGEPVRLGVPLALGTCVNERHVGLVDAEGLEHPLQTRVLDRWNDGSIRWLLLDFHADHNGGATPVPCDLVLGLEPAASRVPAVAIAKVGGGLAIDTGAARFLMGPGEHFPFTEVLVSDLAAIDACRSRFDVIDERGERCSSTIINVDAEEKGPLRAIVKVDASVRCGGRGELIQIVARLHFFAGSATVRVDLTMRNPRRARHAGGVWELGDTGSVYIRDASLSVALPEGGGDLRLRCSPEPDVPFETCGDSVEVYQDSSGQPNWSGRNHLNRAGSVTTRFSGYRYRRPQETRSLHATPVLSVSRGAAQLVMAVPRFWQNFPKALEAAGDVLTLRLFPKQATDLHELQGGEQKTHTFFVAFGDDEVSDVPLDWARAPLFASATSRHYSASGAVPYLTPAAEDPNAEYLALVRAALEGDDTFERKRDVIDEYGWRNFGDLYADHEQAFYSGPERPMISHYNNQYDAVGGFAIQFMRTGDPRWWHYMADLAAHVVDIDQYHTDRDKSSYNHGLFWHTAHYADAGLSSHRSYPRAAGISGGGPSAEHNYTSGLLLHYYLTGDVRSRDAVIQLGQWVIDADDGNKTPFRWLSRADTGSVSCTQSVSYHGPGRGAGYSINALIDAHQLTGDPRLLQKAEALIRRCIHPADDIDGRGLLDAERRWSYIVFLYVLGKYLDYKAERNEAGVEYAYGRAALLAYARWMAVHEFPFLKRGGELEFPTETWAAQDMWKSDVFKFAAKHSAGGERTQFLERAGFFFRYSTSALLGMETHSLVRPTVLMLSHGYMQAYCQRYPETAASRSGASTPNGAFGRPSPFVPQRTQARRRAVVWLAGTALAAVAAGLAFLP